MNAFAMFMEANDACHNFSSNFANRLGTVPAVDDEAMGTV